MRVSVSFQLLPIVVTAFPEWIVSVVGGLGWNILDLGTHYPG